MIKKTFSVFMLFLAISTMCHADWRPFSEVLEDLSSEDVAIRELADGEFGYVEPPSENAYFSLRASNSKSEHVRVYQSQFIVDGLSYYKVPCTFSYFPRPGYHHWIVFLDENKEFVSEFQFPDCREYQWIKLPKSLFQSIKYFSVEERFGPLLR